MLSSSRCTAASASASRRASAQAFTGRRPALAVRCAASSGTPASVDALKALFVMPDGSRLRRPAELIGGRSCMIGMMGIMVGRLGGHSLTDQLFSAPGFFGFLGVIAAVGAASVAPALTGAAAPEKVFPDENDPFPDQLLPDVWTALGEKLNGRAAMIGFALTFIQDAFFH